MLKTAKSLILLISFMVSCSAWAHWDQLSQTQTKQGQFQFEYDSTVKEVRWSVRKGKFGKTRKKGPFKLSDQAFHANFEQLMTDLKSIGPTENYINELLNQVEELRYTTHNACINIPIDPKGQDFTKNLGTLVEEIQKIESRMTSETEVYRSQKLWEMTDHRGVKIVLRGETDKEGELKNIAVFTIPANMKVFVEVHDHGIVVKDDKKTNVMSFKLVNQDQRKLLFISKALEKKSWHDYQHEVFEIKNNNSKLNLDLVSNDIVKSDVEKNGITLTTNEASHFPVKRISADGDYIPLADIREYKDKLTYFISSDHFEWFFEKASPQFERCMQYHVLQRSAGLINLHDESLKNYCEDISIWSVIDKFSNEFVQKRSDEVNQKKADELRRELMMCLKEKQIIDKTGIFSFQVPDEKFQAIADDCNKKLAIHLLRSDTVDNLKSIKLSHHSDALEEAFVKDVVKRGFDDCVKNKNVEKIKDCLTKVKNIEVSTQFYSELSLSPVVEEVHKKQKRTFLEVYKKCEEREVSYIESPEYLSRIKKCGTDLVINMELEFINFNLKSLGREISEVNYEDVSNVDWQSLKGLMKECLQSEFDTLADFSEMRESHDSKRSLCRMRVLKDKLPELYLKKNATVVSKIISDSKDVEKVLASLKSYMSLNLEKFNTLSDINSYLSKQMPVLLSMALKEFYFDRCEHFKQNCDENKELDQKLKLVIGSSDRRPFSQALLKYFISLQDKHDARSLEIHALDLARSITREIAKSNATEEHSKIYEDCLAGFRPNRDSDIAQYSLKCDKVLFSLGHFESVKGKYESLVSLHYPLSSNEANAILTPLQYYKDCLLSLDIQNKLSFEGYVNKTRGCDSLLAMEVGSNLIEHKAKGMKNLFKKADQDKVETNSRSCLAKILSDTEKEIGYSIGTDKTIRSPSQLFSQTVIKANGQLSILSLLDPTLNFEYEFRHKDRDQIISFIEKLGESSVFDQNKFEERISLCMKSAEDLSFATFRDFIVSNIPVIYPSNANKVSQDEIMKSFFDFELLDLILKYTKRHANSFDSRTDSAPLGQRLITTELSLKALSNFIGILGEYLGQGYFFDPAQMKTELVVFQGELKDFLEWSLTQTEQPTIDEFKLFFKESKIADHMALAVMSQRVRNRFEGFINDMKNKELNSYLSRKGKKTESQLSATDKKEYQKIVTKYDRLFALSKQMTSSYDFRRIIRPQGQKGEKLVQEIKDKFLLPGILGTQTKSRDLESIDKQMADFILADNTDGGFTEQFVAKIAQYELDLDEGSHWAITKWFFYDDGDFSWNSLRNTKSGREAIEYYGKFILLPKILGQKLNSQTEALRQERFKKLLSKAQSEND